jgi:hypothetical protein
MSGFVSPNALNRSGRAGRRPPVYDASRAKKRAYELLIVLFDAPSRPS